MPVPNCFNYRSFVVSFFFFLNNFSSLYWICYSIASVFCFGFGCEVCGILVSQPGTEPPAPASEGKVLTTGPQGKSPVVCSEVRKCGSSNLFFCRSVLAIWSPLQSHINLMSGFSTVGKGWWTFQRLCWICRLLWALLTSCQCWVFLSVNSGCLPIYFFLILVSSVLQFPAHKAFTK